MFPFLKYLFLTSIVMSLFISCSYNSEIENIRVKTVEVNFSLQTNNESNNIPSNISKVSTTRRSSAVQTVTDVLRGDSPIEVKGVKIKATSRDFFDSNSSPIVSTGEFTFADYGERGSNPISMRIPYGENYFEAETTSVEAVSMVYENKFPQYKINWYLSLEKDDAMKLSYYSKLINELHPVYAIYKGSVSKTINDSGTNVQIPMKTESCRFNIVIETSIYYQLIAKVTYMVNGTYKSLSTRNRVRNGRATVIVINDEELKDNTPIYITLARYKWNYRVNNYVRIVNYHVKDGTSNYRTQKGVNKTIIINYHASQNY